MIIKSLSFKFDATDKEYFFKNQQITYKPHKINFILGDNGIGKSTLFELLRGDISRAAFFEASIELEGVPYSSKNNKLPDGLTNNIRLVRQDYDTMLADSFTVFENLQLAQLSAYPMLSFLPNPQLLEVAKDFTIPLYQRVDSLSGGQRQLVAILMALQKSTKVLLLDEPTATLDKNNKSLAMQFLDRITKQLSITILIICHDRELVDMYSSNNVCWIEQMGDGSRIIRDA